MNTKILKQFIQAQLNNEYGFKPALKDIIPLEAGGDDDYITDVFFAVNGVEYEIRQSGDSYTVEKLGKKQQDCNTVNELLDKLNDCLQNNNNVDDVIKTNKGELYPCTFDDCPVYFFCISYVPVYIAIDTNAREAFTVDFEG